MLNWSSIDLEANTALQENERLDRLRSTWTGKAQALGSIPGKSCNALFVLFYPYRLRFSMNLIQIEKYVHTIKAVNEILNQI